MKSATRGNAGQVALAGDNGAMPVMAGDDPYRDGRSSRAGGLAGSGEDLGRVPLRELMDDRLLDALLERSRDTAGGSRLTGEGSMLGELVKAVLERALEADLTAHLGYRPARPGRAPYGELPHRHDRQRRCRPGSARCRWPCRGTGPAPSSRC